MDRATGEIMWAMVPIARVPRGERFFMAFAEAFAHLAKHPLPVRERQVLDHLFSILDMDNYLHIKQADVAVELGLDPSHVSRALKSLVEKGFIDAGPKAGRSTTYRMNPHMVWRGKSGARQKALLEAQRRWGMTK